MTDGQMYLAGVVMAGAWLATAEESPKLTPLGMALAAFAWPVLLTWAIWRFGSWLMKDVGWPG